MMLTEAEQLSLDRARHVVRTNLTMVLDGLPGRGEEFGSEDIVSAALLVLCGQTVTTYLTLVKAFAEAKGEMED